MNVGLLWAETLKRRLDTARLPRTPSASHIVPLHVGDAALCMEVSHRLLSEVEIYATPINYPDRTARRGATAFDAHAAAHGRDDGPTGGGAAGYAAADQAAGGLSPMPARPAIQGVAANSPPLPHRKRDIPPTASDL